jgi:ABC-type transport system involved in cytochrome bd biosynthesis fused ATPase/permease subunit
VAVARSIVNDPAILLADEPTGNLNGAMAVEVMEILQAINLRGTTVLVATHDTGLMNRFPATLQEPGAVPRSTGIPCSLDNTYPDLLAVFGNQLDDAGFARGCGDWADGESWATAAQWVD